MSRLIARILLAILMWPLAAMVYFVSAVVLLHTDLYWGYEEWAFWGSGAITWAFVAVYWVLLWRSSVRWESGRPLMTLVAAGGALAISTGVATALHAIDAVVAAFVGSALCPLLWVVGTVIVWRESAAERQARLGSTDAMVCPHCGYNLTGLSEARCPECGTQYTLSELYARQPLREAAEVEA